MLLHAARDAHASIDAMIEFCDEIIERHGLRSRCSEVTKAFVDEYGNFNINETIDINAFKKQIDVVIWFMKTINMLYDDRTVWAINKAACVDDMWDAKKVVQKKLLNEQLRPQIGVVHLLNLKLLLKTNRGMCPDS